MGFTSEMFGGPRGMHQHLVVPGNSVLSRGVLMFRRSTRRCRDTRPTRALVVERLEVRHLLSGITLITHGFNSNVNGWVSAMANAMSTRPDLSIDQPLYRVEVTDPGHDGGPLQVVNTARSGPAPTATTTDDPEITLLLNWTDVAGAPFGGYYRSTIDVAAAVAEQLVSPGFLSDLGTPLAELPFHLLGHSRGASLVGELAHQLGLRGVWVDQVTTWDPHPVDGIREPFLFNYDYGDAPMVGYENVAFWDNYWRTEGNSSLDFTGEPVADAWNLQLSESVLSSGGYGNEHSDTHLWYHGTVDLSENPPANDSSQNVPSAWYGTPHPDRDASGFAFSRMVGGMQPLDGLSEELGGNAVRADVDWSGATWPNVLNVNVTSVDPQFVVGQTVPVTYHYQDADSDATVTWLFDGDRNPYNGNQLLVDQQPVGQTTVLVSQNAQLPTLLLPTGLYYVSAKIVDSGGRARYAYAPQRILLQNGNDFGDAPAPYPTELAAGGARHVATGPRLGPQRDVEIDGLPSTGVDGDDTNGVDDEDGAAFGLIQVGGSIAAANISLENASVGKVDAWIDFDRNGTWDSSEQVLDSVEVSNALQTLNFSLPAGLIPGETVARVRLSSAGNLDPTGPAADGEVEDHLVHIVPPPLVEQVEINHGQAQRSRVDSVTVTFDRVVDIDESGGDPFRFLNVDTNDVVIDQASASVQNGRTVVDFTFAAGPSVTTAGNLIDGNYRLTIDAARVTHYGVGLDGNGDGTAGDDYVFGNGGVDAFFRKYGDGDGNGSVNLFDFAMFRATFGLSVGDPGYEPGLDANEDDVINLFDFAAFRSNFGR